LSEEISTALNRITSGVRWSGGSSSAHDDGPNEPRHFVGATFGNGGPQHGAMKERNLPQQQPINAGALNGLRILDLTRLLPGAFCSQMLADLGAEVVKIEEPTAGDYNRTFPPIAKTESGSFLLLNRNKQSLTLNLKTEAGKDIFRRLAVDADIVLEGFRPGVMDRLGLGFDTLANINPRLIYCAISGFGQDGPYRLMPGHDLNYLAVAGALQLFGTAGGGPIVPGLSVADVGGGSLMAVSGILAAVIARGRTGRGQFIDISMTDGTVAWLALHGADYLFAGIEPRGGERTLIGQAPCYNVYRCEDGRYVALGIIEPHFWERFCKAIGALDLIEEQWPTGEAADRQFARLRAMFAQKPRHVWVVELAEADIPFSGVNSIEEAFADPQLKHRRMLLEVEHPLEGTIPQLGFPIKLSDTPCAIHSAPPRLGEHSGAVLTTLGFDAEAIAALRAAGVI
jgi:crotonobetainyl-CoA:carnitine CoA-transferase CaiB-like acyl-CoA transferase